jgi:5-methylcytosine-specific restriction endonuclease McrA
MPRYRSTSRRTEEQKMKLNVDLRCIPEWEAELKAMPELFRKSFQFNLSKISAAETLFLEMLIKSEIRHGSYPYEVSEEERVQAQRHLAVLKSPRSVDDLFRINYDHFEPSYPFCGKEIVFKIEGRLHSIEEHLAKSREVGVSDSIFVQMFTKKMHAGYVLELKQEKAKLLALLPETSRIKEARGLLDEVSSLLDKYATRSTQLKEKLALAEEKRAAIERFEAKHGKALAKGAAADNKIRKRVTNLKVVVKKTKDCPYCGGDLGVEPHLDHIYPVTKGGLSIVENLIWCCSTCNGLKSDKGLMQFLKEQGLPIEQTLTRLHSIGKHV